MTRSTPLLAPVRRTLGAIARRVMGRDWLLTRATSHGAFLGYLEGFAEGGHLVGWVVRREGRTGNVAVGLYAGERLLLTTVASLRREDVAGVLGNDGQCGFQFEVDDEHLRLIDETGADMTVRTIGEDAAVIGTVSLAPTGNDTALPVGEIPALAVLLAPELSVLLDLVQNLPDQPVVPVVQTPPLARHGRLFATDRMIPDVPVSGQPAYLDYIRYRLRLDEQFKVEPGDPSAEAFLHWYVTGHRQHFPRRLPLSANLIAHLNAPIVLGSQRYHLSRILWARIVGAPDRLGRLNLNDRDSYLSTIFWWAYHDCPALGFEDCLVPEDMVRQLGGLSPARRAQTWPLSNFTERYLQSRPELRILDMRTEAGRKALALVILIAAARRPDLLRYLPAPCMRDALEPGADGGPSALEAFVNELLAADVARPERAAGWPGQIALPRARYAAALRNRQFDLDSLTFLTLTPAGDRLQAAGLPVPTEGDRVDVQVIGPFAKASGLGQAVRLSVAALRETGLSWRAVDFDLDNPAPEGFSSEVPLQPYGPARINLIHLNAESIPLAFAFEPDVFSGAYNIGYFFWELDRPAYSHYLALNLLDEVWVSTEYGVQIYRKNCGDVPVVNVGMSVEDAPGIDRSAARAFLNRKLRLDDQHHVCLVAFDSFSFVQRKNPVGVLQAFLKAFDGVPQARLIVKTQNRDSVFDPVQMAIWQRVDQLIAQDRRILLLNETMPYADLLKLKAGSDCYISLHRSEGWGFGMIEAMNLRVPVVCTAYSGNMDFCSAETAWLVDHVETPLRPGDYIFVREGSRWAEPDIDHAARQLRSVFDDPQLRAMRVEAAFRNIRDNFSARAIGARYADRLRQILSQRAGTE